jgi:hypothetical protein
MGLLSGPHERPKQLVVEAEPDAKLTEPAPIFQTHLSLGLSHEVGHDPAEPAGESAQSGVAPEAPALIHCGEVNVALMRQRQPSVGLVRLQPRLTRGPGPR